MTLLFGARQKSSLRVWRLYPLSLLSGIIDPCPATYTISDIAESLLQKRRQTAMGFTSI
jgi:hypothetical protein